MQAPAAPLGDLAVKVTHSSGWSSVRTADPADNRLAVRTDPHPLEYIDFHGEIPKGQYGAGTMTIWDQGTYECTSGEPRKVEVTFHGERLSGRYGLFPIGRDESAKRLDDPPDGSAQVRTGCRCPNGSSR